MEKEKEKKSGGLLPKIEFIIILVFIISFLVWMIPKCGSNDLPEPPASSANAEEGGSTLVGPALPPEDSAKLNLSEPLQPRFKADQSTRLYVTIDGLNLRRSPDLSSEVLVRLPLFEEVYFLNEVTDSTFQISLGYEIADEPYVKVRSKKGHVGWVYGAGVNYYKKKRGGTID
jgi:hypothetical protein